MIGSIPFVILRYIGLFLCLSIVLKLVTRNRPWTMVFNLVMYLVLGLYLLFFPVIILLFNPSK